MIITYVNTVILTTVTIGVSVEKPFDAHDYPKANTVRGEESNERLAADGL
jgi:hypothetical protein